MTAPTTQPLDHSLDGRAALVVDAAAAPEWVLRWCHGSGQGVRTGPLGGASHAVAEGARTGESVLVLRAHLSEPSAPRVVAALHSLPTDVAVLADALDAALHLGGSLTLLHAVPVSFGPRSVGLAEALRLGEDLLHDARALVDFASVPVPLFTRLVRMWPHELVGPHLDADLLAVGGPRTGAEGEVGLVAATAVRHAPCPVLVSARPAAARPGFLWTRKIPGFPTPRRSTESTPTRADR
jgi:nucleotide-binding universal stress UspA family protein